MCTVTPDWSHSVQVPYFSGTNINVLLLKKGQLSSFIIMYLLLHEQNLIGWFLDKWLRESNLSIACGIFHGIWNLPLPTIVGPGCEVEKMSKLSELDIATFKEGTEITIGKIVFNSPFHWANICKNMRDSFYKETPIKHLLGQLCYLMTKGFSTKKH